MTAKHRNKNNIIDKNSHSSPDDVARKPSEGKEVRGPGNWTKVLAVICYVILVAAVGSAALYLQRVLGEMGRLIHRTEEVAQKYADLTLRLDSVHQQVESLSSVVEAFDPTVATIRAELQGVAQAQRRGEAESRRAEDVLEEELKALSRTFGDGLAQIRLANQRTETDTKALREQVDSLRTELQTANQRAAVAAQEAESARALAEASAGELGRAVTAVEGRVGALTQQALDLQAGLQQTRSGIQSATARLQDAAAQGERLGAQLKVLEDTVDTLSSSGLEPLLSRTDAQASALAALDRDVQSAREVSEAKVAALHAALGDIQQAHRSLSGQVGVLQSDLGALQSAAAILNSTQTEQSERDSRLTLELERLDQRLSALGEALREAQASHTLKASAAQENLRRLMTSVDGLLKFSSKVKGHVDAIASVQSALEETNASVSAMSKKKHNVPGGNV